MPSRLEVDESSRRAAPQRSLGAADRLSPQPILAAVENYRGKIIDLDHQQTVDCAALAAARAALVRRLADGGIRSGDRVVVAIGNGPLFVTTLAAVLELGASPLLVHDQLPPAELRRTALRYGAAFVLSDSHEPAACAEIGAGHTIHDDGWIRCVQTAIDTADPLFVAHYPVLHGVPLHPTSGSTGLPKVAVRPGPCAVAEAVNYIERTGIDHGDTLLVVTPMSHAYAYGMGLMVPLLSGATIVSMRKFGLQKVLDALAHAGVTVFPAVPAVLDTLLFGRGGGLLAAPRLVLSAGAPLTRRTVENFAAVTGRHICPLYGTTETGGISVDMEGATADEADCVGQPLIGAQARLQVSQDPDAHGDPARVEIRSTSMMAGYLSAGVIDSATLHDGWFLTGDVGRLGPRGIHLRGRESDVINVAGMKVVPSEVEEVLAAFPGVIECKVYAGERRPGHQFVKAAVVVQPSVDLAQLRAHCQQQLVYYKRPSTITCLDALPRSSAGKILKNQLP